MFDIADQINTHLGEIEKTNEIVETHRIGIDYIRQDIEKKSLEMEDTSTQYLKTFFPFRLH